MQHPDLLLIQADSLWTLMLAGLSSLPFGVGEWICIRPGWNVGWVGYAKMSSYKIHKYKTCAPLSSYKQYKIPFIRLLGRTNMFFMFLFYITQVLQSCNHSHFYVNWCIQNRKDRRVKRKPSETFFVSLLLTVWWMQLGKGSAVYIAY